MNNDNNNQKNHQDNAKPVGLFADKAYEPVRDSEADLRNENVNADTELSLDKPASDEQALSVNTAFNNNASKKTIASGEALKLAVVGHTNTGKTSLLRTLLRDVYFGEVKNEAATTRHVEQAKLTDSQTGEVLVVLYDTPGLEDASGLMDWLEDNTASRRDGIERLQQFLAADSAN